MRIIRPCLNPPPFSLPLFGGRVPCGFPSPAQDYVEGPLDLNQLCVSRPAATFFVRAEGDSMVDVGIFPGDLLVVDRSVTPQDRDIVVALLDGGFTVKRLQLRPRLRLLPANSSCTPIELSPDQSFELFGVVTYIIARARGRDDHSAG